MGRKKKKQRAEEIQPLKQEIPVEDDPYWKISGIYMDAHRVGRFINMFERFEAIHPEWVDDLMSGIPTYYCVLGVRKGAPKSEVDNAYEKKSDFTSYPDEVIEEAFDVLSNLTLQKEYGNLLSIFEQITKCMPPSEKNDLIRKHSMYVSVEKEYARMGQLLRSYKDFVLLYMHGMPDLYELSGIPKDSIPERTRCDSGSELFKKICTILSNPASREDYNYVMGFIAKHTDKKQLQEREKQSNKWRKLDRRILERIVLAVLNEPGVIGKYMQQRIDILNSNQDWKQYLPPNKETFLSILGLDTSSLSGDKKDVETTIREKYRYLEKTPTVNLAYSVLKNALQREDYLWLLENHELLETLIDVLSLEKIQKEIMQETHPGAQTLEVLARILAEKISREAKGGKGKKPTPQEVLDVLTRIFAEEGKPPKRVKK